jgi:hypothetical protein
MHSPDQLTLRSTISVATTSPSYAYAIRRRAELGMLIATLGVDDGTRSRSQRECVLRGAYRHNGDGSVRTRL